MKCKKREYKNMNLEQYKIYIGIHESLLTNQNRAPIFYETLGFNLLLFSRDKKNILHSCDKKGISYLFLLNGLLPNLVARDNNYQLLGSQIHSLGRTWQTRLHAVPVGVIWLGDEGSTSNRFHSHTWQVGVDYCL